MRQFWHNIIMAFIFVSCGMNTSSNDMPVDTDTYQKDKQEIHDVYVNNIEYYRMHHLYNIDTIDYVKHYKEYPYAQYDPANFYSPYGCRVSKEGSIFVPSPYSTNSQLNIEVDIIIYDKSGSLFIAFVCIEKKFKESPSLKNIKHGFDGRAMIGYRDEKTKVLKVYPLTNFMSIGMNSKNEVLQAIKKDYMNKLKGSYLSGSVYGANKFGENVGNNSFFQESQFFKKNYDGLYLFQLYKDLDEIKEYKYPFGS